MSANEDMDQSDFCLLNSDTYLHILENILGFLPAYDLTHDCSLVSSLWHQVCKKLLQKRQTMSWGLQGRASSPKDDHAHVVAHFRNLWSVPSHVFAFASQYTVKVPILLDPNTNADGEPQRKQRRVPFSKETFDSYLRRFLSASAIFCVYARGVVGTDGDGVTHEMEKRSGGSFLLLPSLPRERVRIHRLRLSSSDREALKDRKSFPGIPDGETQPKALLLFANDASLLLAEDVVEVCQKISRSQMVIAGGLVQEVAVRGQDTLPSVPQDDDDDPNDFLGVAFCGEGVRAASIVLTSDVTKKSTVENRLIQLRDTGVHSAPSSKQTSSRPTTASSSHGRQGAPSSSVFGLMFACVERGAHHYKECDVEASLFRKVFPGVPLLGFFGNGEIGYDYLPKLDSEDSNNRTTDSECDKNPAPSGGQEQGRGTADQVGPQHGQSQQQPNHEPDEGEAGTLTVREWLDLSDDDDSDSDDDFEPTFHASSTIFAIISLS